MNEENELLKKFEDDLQALKKSGIDPDLIERRFKNCVRASREKLLNFDVDKIIASWMIKSYAGAYDELRGKIILDKNLKKVNFVCANLSETKFIKCGLYRANFSLCIFKQTVFEDCFLLRTNILYTSQCLFIHNGFYKSCF